MSYDQSSILNDTSKIIKHNQTNSKRSFDNIPNSSSRKLIKNEALANNLILVLMVKPGVT
jgi:hypothetical protein